MARHALARRYNRGDPDEEVARWSYNTRRWWARAERSAPRELEVYRRATGNARRAALAKLKEALK
jgi:hypothetical protein